MIQFQTLLGKEEKSQTIPLNAVLPTKLMWPHQPCALFMLLTVTTLLENVKWKIAFFISTSIINSNSHVFSHKYFCHVLNIFGCCCWVFLSLNWSQCVVGSRHIFYHYISLFYTLFFDWFSQYELQKIFIWEEEQQRFTCVYAITVHFCVQLNSKYKWMQWVGQLASRQLVVTFKIKLPASELCNRKVFIIWRSLVQTPQPSVAWSPRGQNCLVPGLIGYRHFSKLRGFWINFWILGSIFIALNIGRHGSKQKASVSHAIR